MTAGYWSFIFCTITIFNPPSIWPAHCVCMTLFIESWWSEPWLQVTVAISWWPGLPQALSAQRISSRSAANTVITEQRSRPASRTGYQSWAEHARPVTLSTETLSDTRVILRRWIMSNLVPFTYWLKKDKRVDLFTQYWRFRIMFVVLLSVLCNSEHWTYFQGTCIRLYFVGILLISYC